MLDLRPFVADLDDPADSLAWEVGLVMGGSASIVGGILVVVLTEPPRSESIHLTVRDPDGQTATSSLTVNILPLPDLIGLIPDLSFDVDSFAEVALDEFVASDISPPPHSTGAPR